MAGLAAVLKLGDQLPHAGAFGRLSVRRLPGLALDTKKAARPAEPGTAPAAEYQASVRPLCPHRSAKIYGPDGFRVINARTGG